MLGSGVPLPKILNIDFSNADIDVLEVRRELCSALCSRELCSALCPLPLCSSDQELGGRREGRGKVGQRRPLPSKDGSKGTRNKGEEPLNEVLPIHHLISSPGEMSLPHLADGNTEAQSRKGLTHSRSAIWFTGKIFIEHLLSARQCARGWEYSSD